METKLSPPWIIYWRKLEALFGQDPEIHIEFDEIDYVISLFVDNDIKAEALCQILPTEKTFGNITVYIEVIPSNIKKNLAQYYVEAFTGNPVFEEKISSEGIFHSDYIVFKNEVVQFFSDNLADPHGQTSTLYQDIADEIFEDRESGIYFCTGFKK